jgi:RNA polymerase sigma-70 factor (ECF subfamily)
MTLQKLKGDAGAETRSAVCAASRDEPTELVAELFEKHRSAIYAYVYRLVDDREWAHDLTQETFLRVFRARQRLPQVENRRAWVYRVATNVAINALRRRRRFTWLPWRQIDNSTKNGAALAGPNPAERSDQRVAIEQTLMELPPRYRAPLLLYSHYGFSVREVAETLDISPGAVKTRLYRAREMFRQGYARGEEHERA